LILLSVAAFFYFAQQSIITDDQDKPIIAQKKEPVRKSGKEQYLSHAEIIENWLTLRGTYSNGVAYNVTPPVQWNGKTGECIIWKVKIDLPGKSSPVVHKNQILITGAAKDKKVVSAYNFTTGKLLWTVNVNDHVKGASIKADNIKDTGYAASTMAADGKRMFAIFTTGEIICFSYKGEYIWSKHVNVSDNMYGHASSLITFENKLYVQLDKTTDSKLLVLNSVDGAIIKTIARTDMISWASPVIYNQKEKAPQIIVNANPYTVSYNPVSDTENWRAECLTGDVASSICYYNDRIYATNIRSCLFSLNASDGKIIWESCDPVCPDTSSPVATVKFLFMATAPGVVSCINTADGSILWEEEFNNIFYSSPILADNKIFLIITDFGGE